MNRREMLVGIGATAVPGGVVVAEAKDERAEDLYWDAQMLICDLEELYNPHKVALGFDENSRIMRIIDILHAIPRPS